MSTLPASVEQGLQAAGVGKFQYRLFVIFGLVWLADAMQVLSIGFSAPTIAKTFGLTVPQALQTGTMFFVGMLLGAFVFGRLADRIGRRPVLMGAVVIDACFGVASAFAPDFTWLLALRLLTGIGVGGTLPVDYTMMAEFLPSARRGRWLVMLESFWAIGTICLAVLALVAVSWGNDAWRVIFFVTGLPALVGVVLRFYVPESPMYLNRSGKSDAARQVLERVAKVNGSSTPIPPLQPEVVERKPMSALFSAALRRRSLSLYLAWGLISIAYYGVFVYLPVKLGSEGFGFMRGQIFLIFLALVQLPGYALSAYGVERWGRKPTLVGFLVLSAVAKELRASMSGIGGAGGGFHAVVEFFPAGYLGSAVRLHARGLSHRPARQRHGHGRRGGPLRRPVRPGHRGARHGQPFHAGAGDAVGLPGGRRRGHSVRGCGVAQSCAGVVETVRQCAGRFKESHRMRWLFLLLR